MSDPAPDLTSDARPSATPDQVIEGRGVSPGTAVGVVYRHSATTPEVDRTHVTPDEVADELSLLDEALARAQDELARVRSVAADTLGPEGTDIFEAQELMLDDDELLRAIRTRVEEEHESAAHALTTVLQRHRERLGESEDPYLRERTNDLDELEGRLLRALQREQVATTLPPDAIVVSDRLTAADIIRFNQHGMRGCVTNRGGPTSHAAIIARALSVPAIMGADEATEAVASRDRAVVDGRRGRLIVHPSADTLDRYEGRRKASDLDNQGCRSNGRLETADGRPITLQANVDFDETLDRFEEYGAAGIGLVRTEMFLLGGGEAPLAEEEQVTIYRRAAAATGADGATIRLLDLGGDKLLPIAEQEENPFLGWRGVRVLLDRSDELLRPQVRALLRANAHGTLRVLLPMVTHLDEVRRIRAVIEDEAERLSAHGTEHDADLPLGVMVEVPAVAVQARAFAEAADFLSIGTNDLTQYVLAVDRGNERVADRYDALHPAVLQLVRRTVEAGRATDTPVALCGEVAGDLEAVPILLGLGLQTLSVAPSSLPSVERVVCRTAQSAAVELAETACSASDATVVRRRARDWLHDHVQIDDLFGAPPPK